MSRPPLVPPIKCQGIKTKLAGEIRRIAGELPTGRWIEPFCGSISVALNIAPKRALLADTNIHIIRFYQDIQDGKISANTAREFLEMEGNALRFLGEDHFYHIRERFNSQPNSLDFLFLNRACFNGVMRFNRSGKFNVPFCRKPERFAPAYITKISNQIQTVAQAISQSDWIFEVSDFRNTIKKAGENDIIYADPPYTGRHTDYFNNWSANDEADLAEILAKNTGKFILSTWHSNEFRTNLEIKKNWARKNFHIFTRPHFYHVGATETLRHPMLEALITNYPVHSLSFPEKPSQQALFVEQEPAPYLTTST